MNKRIGERYAEVICIVMAFCAVGNGFEFTDVIRIMLAQIATLLFFSSIEELELTIKDKYDPTYYLYMWIGKCVGWVISKIKSRR